MAAAAVEAQEQAERGASQPAPAQAPVQAQAPVETRTAVSAPVHAQASTAHQPPVPVELRTARSGDTLALDGAPSNATAGPGRLDPRPMAEDTGGIGGLFGGASPAQAVPAGRRDLPRGLRPRPQVGPPPPASGGHGQSSGQPPRRRGVLLVLAALAVVLVVAGIGTWALTGGTRNAGAGQAAPTTSAPSSAAPSAPVVGDTVVVGGTTFTLQAVEDDDTCQGHAYNAVADFFASSDCTALTRSLWSADADGRPAVVSVSEVTMADTANAQALRALADTDGSGNVNDLLREGVRYDGGPTKLVDAQYASAQKGTTVTIVETSWSGQAGASSALDALASTALSLSDDDG